MNRFREKIRMKRKNNTNNNKMRVSGMTEKGKKIQYDTVLYETEEYLSGQSIEELEQLIDDIEAQEAVRARENKQELDEIRREQAIERRKKIRFRRIIKKIGLACLMFLIVSGTVYTIKTANISNKVMGSEQDGDVSKGNADKSGEIDADGEKINVTDGVGEEASAKNENVTEGNTGGDSSDNESTTEENTGGDSSDNGNITEGNTGGDLSDNGSTTEGNTGGDSSDNGSTTEGNTGGDSSDNGSTTEDGTGKSTDDEGSVTDGNADGEGEQSERMLVAFTFDDGPFPAVTNRILDILEQYNASATFFMMGSRVSDYSDTVRRVIATTNCEVANHTYSHKDLTTLSAEKLKEEVAGSEAIIAEYAGYGHMLLRPPYGAKNNFVAEKAGVPLILWSVDSEDWKYKNCDKIVEMVLANVSDGDIILMHDLYYETADAVEELVPVLIEMGYDIVSVSELFERKGMELEDGKWYFYAK